ncbi:hypothetical protein KVR01_012850 [Diaporthe batatas]|uniref:uncharacterized protein n=1 Tax=Diaporthe batatas TaxID=748121 RepID=UPI001D049AEB|nr:uncharacterized protein KVR01_012850 [Diaporthe batatas]KAG8157466.1 hypothetical protein KVR01_012850 [Diaporthe batatas]
MSDKSSADEVLSATWSIQNLIQSVSFMMDEVECNVLLTKSLPDEVLKGLCKTINDIETKVLRRRAALSLAQNHTTACYTEADTSQRELDEILLIGSTPSHTSFQSQSAADEGSIRSEDLDTEYENKDSRAPAGEIQGTIDSLHESIKAIQSAVLSRMNASMPSKESTTSSMVSFSILEEEMEILDGLLKHVVGSYKASDDESSDWLEIKLVGLPTLLSALFNMEIREAVEDGSDIDDNVMMEMVVANQTRTNILRNIEAIAKRVKDLALKSKTMLEESGR